MLRVAKVAGADLFCVHSCIFLNCDGLLIFFFLKRQYLPKGLSVDTVGLSPNSQVLSRAALSVSTDSIFY